MVYLQGRRGQESKDILVSDAAIRGILFMRKRTHSRDTGTAASTVTLIMRVIIESVPSIYSILDTRIETHSEMRMTDAGSPFDSCVSSRALTPYIYHH